MLAFLAAPLENGGWLAHGGTETLMAYGVQPPPTLGSEDSHWIEVGAQLKANLPEAHAAFLVSLERQVQLGDYLFVHAGIDPELPLDKQNDTALFWIRDRFLNDRRPLSQRVVHGHTPADQPYADPRRIGLDTGAYASGILTAARFEGEGVEFLSVLDRAANARTDGSRRRKKARRH
jgi:serine/threonine protein phosphatase 1